MKYCEQTRDDQCFKQRPTLVSSGLKQNIFVTVNEIQYSTEHRFWQCLSVLRSMSPKRNSCDATEHYLWHSANYVYVANLSCEVQKI